jgi:hypothetical protein
MRWRSANNTPVTGGGSEAAADPNGMLAIVGGVAAAAGNDTLATGTVTAQMVDRGPVDIARGSATFSAAAQTTDGSKPLAVADTYAGVSGADIVITRTTKTNTIGQNSAAATSETNYFAVDIAKWSPPPGGGIHVDVGTTISTTNWGYGKLKVPDGNLASVSAGAEAIANNSLAETSTGALAVENQFSAVEGAAVTAIA